MPMTFWILTQATIEDDLGAFLGQEEALLRAGRGAGGRGVHAQVNVGERVYLLKPYLRGGALRHLFGNIHFGRGRLRAELDLTARMETAGLPVSRLRAITGSGWPRRAYAWILPDPATGAIARRQFHCGECNFGLRLVS